MGKINVNSRANVIDEDGMIWLSENYFNGLFKFNVKTKQLEFVGYFDNVPKDTMELHLNAFTYENEVIFTPYYGKAIEVYDKKTNKFMSIKIPVQDNVTYFHNSVKVRDFIYIMSDDFRMWEYNLKNKEINEKKEMTAICKEFASKVQNDIIARCNDETMILFERGGKQGCKIDFRTFEVTYLMAEIEKNLDILFYDGEQYWFFLCDSLDVVSWDGKQSYKVYKSDNDEWIKDKKVAPYSEIKKVNGQIFISNYYAKHIMKVNEEKQVLERSVIYPSDFKVLRYNGYGGTFIQIHAYEGKVIFVPGRGNMILFYEPEKQVVEGIKLEIEKKEIPQFQKILQSKLKNGIVEDEGIAELNDLISGWEMESGLKEKNHYGQAIWCECSLLNK